jgi:hypothetical protein
MPYLSNIITSVVVARYNIGLCCVMGCYMSYITVVTPIGPFGCITKSNNTQTNTTSSNNHKSASVAQMRHISSYNRTQHKPILYLATTTEVIMLLR